MNYLKKIGKALLLPIAIFPIAAILIGIGAMLARVDATFVHFLSVILRTSGEAILGFMPVAFAIGVAYGLSDHHKGISAFAGLFVFLIITNVLAQQRIDVYDFPVDNFNQPFEHIDNQFIGILSGVVASAIYNRLHKLHLDTLNENVILLLVSLIVSLGLCCILIFVWPFIYNKLIQFGNFISSLGPLGAGIYAFFNRLLIPIGMHHPLNSVFWFDVVGINDIGNFWSSQGTYGVTGMYQAGFFPVMMFGLPAAALAMLRTAYPQNKKKVRSFLLSAAFASFFTGLTEPLEFSFMFIAPQLYLVHAAITGISVFIAAQFQWIAGFSFSAGFIDFMLSLQMPFTRMPLMLLIMGVVLAIAYYFGFTYIIKRNNLHTLGREIEVDHRVTTPLQNTEIDTICTALIYAVGGMNNVQAIDCCITRVRFHLHNPKAFNFELLKQTGAIEYMQFGDEIQIVYGPNAGAIVEHLESILGKQVKHNN